MIKLCVVLGHHCMQFHSICDLFTLVIGNPTENADQTIGNTKKIGTRFMVVKYYRVKYNSRKYS